MGQRRKPRSPSLCSFCAGKNRRTFDYRSEAQTIGRRPVAKNEPGEIVLLPRKRKSPCLTLFWACPRPKTKHWGSGQVWDRICKEFGTPDAAFGKTDGIPDGIAAYDLNNGFDWKRLPLSDNRHEFGFWDPPYFNDDHTRFKMFKPEAQEIWRVCKR